MVGHVWGKGKEKDTENQANILGPHPPNKMSYWHILPMTTTKGPTKSTITRNTCKEEEKKRKNHTTSNSLYINLSAGLGAAWTLPQPRLLPLWPAGREPPVGGGWWVVVVSWHSTGGGGEEEGEAILKRQIQIAAAARRRWGGPAAAYSFFF